MLSFYLLYDVLDIMVVETYRQEMFAVFSRAKNGAKNTCILPASSKNQSVTKHWKSIVSRTCCCLFALVQVHNLEMLIYLQN